MDDMRDDVLEEEENRVMLDSGLEDSSSDYDENQNAEPEMQVEDSGQPPHRNRLEVNRFYDTELPSLHSYLGRELEVVRGRTVLEEKDTVKIPLLHLREVVLMPGQTLPLSVFDTASIEMLRVCLQDDRTFGVIALWDRDPYKVKYVFGMTAEIFEYLPNNGHDGFRIKAKGRQRFRMLDSNFRCNSNSKARVEILPEVNLSDPLEYVKLQSLYRHRTSALNRQRFRRMDAAVTHWPAFVYEQYNVNRLVREMAIELTALQGKDSQVNFPKDPAELSYWVGQNVPMLEEHRLKILQLNSPIQRLRWELKAMQQYHQFLCCNSCNNRIGSRSDMFAMSEEGLQSTYVNPGGYLHETMTFYKVKGTVSEGRPSTEFSWFPGYAWTICRCKECGQHLGWKFLATKSYLRPVKFWGISRNNIKVSVNSWQKADNTCLVY